jgi:ParB-like chromosome segregation protein Spo0J
MPKRVAKGDVVVAKLEDLHEIPGPNPNYMPPEKEAELRASILMHGYRQLITAVDRDEGGYWISDGVHRKKILLELGYEKVPVLSKEGTVDTVRAERLSLNRPRGQVDLSLAAADLKLLVEAGWEPTQFVACGFSDDEVKVLLASTEQVSDESVLEVGLEAGPASEQTTEAVKRYTLTMTFDSKDERDALRGKLLAMGASVEEGLRALLGRGTQ